jgi:hypothetical protein
MTSLVVALLLPLVAVAQPSVVLEADRVSVENVTPGGEVLYLAVVRERDGWTTRRLQLRGQVADSDLDGAVTIEVDGGVPPVSVWIVIDLGSGGQALASPIGPVRMRQDMLPPTLVSDAEGELPSLRVSHSQVSVLIARAGSGGWLGRVGDGAAGDLDLVVDGTIDVDTSVLQPVDARTPALDRMQAGDVVAVVDGRALEVGMMRVATSGR